MENQPTFCPNCGKEIEAGSVFCTNCGTKMENQPANETSTANSVKPFVTEEQREILKNGATNLWEWIVSAVKAPTKNVQENTPLWFSWLSIILTAIFGALA